MSEVRRGSANKISKAAGKKSKRKGIGLEESLTELATGVDPGLNEDRKRYREIVLDFSKEFIKRAEREAKRSGVSFDQQVEKWIISGMKMEERLERIRKNNVFLGRTARVKPRFPFLICTMDNGNVFKVDMKWAWQDGASGSLSKALRKKRLFEQVSIGETGQLFWPNGFDLAPHFPAWHGKFQKHKKLKGRAKRKRDALTSSIAFVFTGVTIGAHVGGGFWTVDGAATISEELIGAHGEIVFIPRRNDE